MFYNISHRSSRATSRARNSGRREAGQLAPLKTWHHWQRSRIAGRLKPGTQGQREGKRKEEGQKKEVKKEMKKGEKKLKLKL